jgi:hypothetical protein
VVAVLRCCTATGSTSSALLPPSTTQPPGAGDGDEESAAHRHGEVRGEGPWRGVFKEGSVECNSDQGGCQCDRPQEQYEQPCTPGAQPRSHWISMHPTHRRRQSPSLLLPSCAWATDRPGFRAGSPVWKSPAPDIADLALRRPSAGLRCLCPTPRLPDRRRTRMARRVDNSGSLEGVRTGGGQTETSATGPAGLRLTPLVEQVCGVRACRP